MSKEKRRIWPFVVLLLFLLYFFIGARPVPKEKVLSPRWLSSIESGQRIFSGGSQDDEINADPFSTIPFAFNGRFGYVDTNGRFALNNEKFGHLSLSKTKWALYGAQPTSLEIRNNFNNTVETIDKPRGYPAFMGGRTFIIGSEQNDLCETDGAGGILWAYETSAPITCADATADLALIGTIDGVVEVLDLNGRKRFVFEPGGSRYSIILGCAFSHDGSRIALVCGIGLQRFLLLERYGNNYEYKVVYHEFLENGFRRPVFVNFIDRDKRVVFEREGGLGVYEAGSRKSYKAALKGDILAIDNSGEAGQLFVIADSAEESNRMKKYLIGISLPNKVFIRAPFYSDDVFLGRIGSQLFLGGGSTLASFDLERK